MKVWLLHRLSVLFHSSSTLLDKKATQAVAQVRFPAYLPAECLAYIPLNGLYIPLFVNMVSGFT